MKHFEFNQKLDDLVEEMTHLKVRFDDFDSYYSYLDQLSTYIMQERGETETSHPGVHNDYMIRHLSNVRDIALEVRNKNIQITTGEVKSIPGGYMMIYTPIMNSVPRIARDYANQIKK